MGNTIYRENTSYRKNTFYTENTIYSIMAENLPTYPPRRHRPLLDDVLDNKASRGRGSEGEREKSKSENRKSDFSDILFLFSLPMIIFLDSDFMIDNDFMTDNDSIYYK